VAKLLAVDCIVHVLGGGVIVWTGFRCSVSLELVPDDG
jgi:hypothetical protein